MPTIEQKVIIAWQKAANDLGFCFITPFIFSLPDRKVIRFLGLIQDYGGPKGTVVGLIGQENSHTLKCLSAEGYYFSFLNPETHNHYTRDYFVDILNDWGWFGASDNKPDWYTGKPWG